MSGGSMNYLYSKIEYGASFEQSTPLRRAFKSHLLKVAKALHDIEWVDSCDYAKGDEDEAIRACLPENAEMSEMISEAKEILKSLSEALEKEEGE